MGSAVPFRDVDTEAGLEPVCYQAAMAPVGWGKGWALPAQEDGLLGGRDPPAGLLIGLDHGVVGRGGLQFREGLL